MQCSMCNQCSGLFTCIKDYLHVLCMTLIMWICVICVTLMVFIYVYYGLFAWTNLVDVMSLFFMIFFVPMTNFLENSTGFCKNRPGITSPIFGKSQRFLGEFGR
jgi:hypothetical protein